MKESILIVDDHRNTREGMASALNTQYRVYTAANGLEALHLLDEYSDIHIVITDFFMPEMNGLELLKKIHLKYKKTKVIMISGYPDIEMQTEAKELGVYNYFMKPINLDRLEDAIKRASENIQYNMYV